MDILNPNEILDYKELPTDPYESNDRDSVRSIPVFSPEGEIDMDGTIYQMTSSYNGRITSFSNMASTQDKIYLLTIDGTASDHEDLSFSDLVYTLYKGNDFFTLDQLATDESLLDYAHRLILKTLETYVTSTVTPSKNEHWNLASETARKKMIRLLEQVTVSA